MLRFPEPGQFDWPVPGKYDGTQSALAHEEGDPQGARGRGLTGSAQGRWGLACCVQTRSGVSTPEIPPNGRDRTSRPTELRRSPRVLLRLNARLSTIHAQPAPDGSEYYALLHLESLDVSADGIALRSEVPLAPGEPVVVEAEIGPGTHLERSGRVAWRRCDARVGPTVVGIAFEPAGDPEQQAAWTRFAQALSMADSEHR